jgi:hypothetical protein
MSGSKSFVYILLLCSLVFTSCSRYNYIPRKINFFDHKNAKQERQEKDVKLSKVESEQQDKELMFEESSSEKSVLQINQKPINENTNIITQKVAYRQTIRLMRQHFLPEASIRNRVKELQKISYHQTLIKEKLKQPNTKPEDEDPQDSDPEFHPLALISGLLGVISWASLVVMELYWMLFWSEYLILLSILAAVGALITGIIALSLTKKGKGDFNNRYMAVIGIVMGGIEVIALLLVFISILLFFGL